MHHPDSWYSSSQEQIYQLSLQDVQELALEDTTLRVRDGLHEIPSDDISA